MEGHRVTVWLVALFLHSGNLQMVARPVPTMELCAAALPEVAKVMPEGVTLLCVEAKGLDA